MREKLDSGRERKAYRLEILGQAQRELEEIARTHLELVGAFSARKITDRILGALDRLRIYPYMGVSCADKPLRLEQYRALICEPYLCIYRVQAQSVLVCHIVDARSNYPALLRDLQKEP